MGDIVRHGGAMYKILRGVFGDLNRIGFRTKLGGILEVAKKLFFG